MSETAPQPRWRAGFARAARWSAALVAALLLATLTRVLWLPWAAALLIVNEAAVPSDVVVVASGQVSTRLPVAARLIRAGYAHTLLTGSSGELDRTFLLMGMRVTDTDILWRLVDRERVPRDAVTITKGVTSTQEDALAFREYARTHNIRSAILVTSHLHSRRARWAFRHALEGLPVQLTTVEAPQSDFRVDRWWQDEDGLLTVANEYLKFGFYLTHY